jgi:hypothetical protein
MLIKEKDSIIVTWVLNMQKARLFITFQQLNLKVVEVT